MKVKTHTFRHGVYRITQGPGYDGICDIPDDSEKLDMLILDGGDLRSLNTAIHEAMHAEGIPEKYVHDLSPDRIARFLWRLGWRKNGDSDE